MKSFVSRHVLVGVVTAVGLGSVFVGGASVLGAASPAAGTLSATSAPIEWTGPSGPGVSPDGEATCVDGLTCDVFTLTIAPGDYTGKRVRFRVSWTNQLNDFDVYVHESALTGPETQRAASGPPSTAEENTFDLNRPITAGVNDTYVIHVVYFAVAVPDPYHGTISLEDIPDLTTSDLRNASFVKGSKTGIRFSRSRTVYAPGAGQDVEPSARVDFQGNAYAGGIRGLTGGNDVWRFDLNPDSPTYDPFLRAATPVFDGAGNAQNPAYTGQPDSTVPDKEGDLGGDGGGDLDLAVGFKTDTTGSAPTLAASSLVAANVSTQRSFDRGDTYENNPLGNTTVPVDDRQWLEFLGSRTVYLGYRDFTGLQATSKYYINRSDDGGLTYGPAIVAAIGGNTTGNIDVDQRDGTVYFCHQGDGDPGNREVRVAVGHPLSPAVPPLTYSVHVAATGRGNIATLFPVCKVASDGTAYVAYSDAGEAIYLTHSLDQGTTWAPPVRVSDLGPGSVSLMPWIETGDRHGSVAIVWYGSAPATNEGGSSGNTDSSNWQVYYAETLNATASSPTVLQTVASDHFNHGSNISLAGFTTGESPNRNLADFFQVAVDPLGLGFVTYADDSIDFAGHTYVTHQIAGPSLNTGRNVRIKGRDNPDPVDAFAPEVNDFRHDAVVFQPPPIRPDVDSAADIVSIDFGCQAQDGRTLIVATLAASGLETVPPHGIWRMNFATTPTTPGLSDRADQWFLQASTDDTGARTYTYGTAVRNSDGSITYTPRGAADAGGFDLSRRTVTVKVDVANLNALQQRGPIASGTTLIGLRGGASVERTTVAGLVGVGLADSTRAGRAFKLGSACF